MSALAAATQALAKRKEEQMAIMVQLQSWAELKVAGVAGCLNVSVVSVHATDETAPPLEDVQIGWEAADATGECKVLEKLNIKLITKDTMLNFSGSCIVKSITAPESGSTEETGSEGESGGAAKEGGEKSTTSTKVLFTAGFDCKESPDDTVLNCDLETVSSIPLVVRIQVGFDSCDAVLASKKTELEQNETECRQLAQAIREAATASSSSSSSSSSTPTPKKEKKSPKKSSKTANDASSDSESLVARAGRLLRTSSARVGVAGEMLNHTRAYWLFAVASAAIYFYGEYASI